MTTVNKITNSMIRVKMTAQDRRNHRQLRNQLKDLNLPGTPVANKLPALDRLLNSTAETRASALTGLAHHIKPDQETVIFCRNPYELNLARQACEEAGKNTLNLNPNQDDSQTWEDHGGILLATVSPEPKYPQLHLARQAIHFGYHPSRQRFLNLCQALNPKQRRRKLEITYIMAADSADEIVANALIQAQHEPNAIPA